MKINRDPLSAKDISPVLPVPYVQSITDVLSSHLGWHRARLKFMARFTSAVLAMTTTNLRRIAIALKAGVEAKSNYRRIQRFPPRRSCRFRAARSDRVGRSRKRAGEEHDEEEELANRAKHNLIVRGLEVSKSVRNGWVAGGRHAPSYFRRSPMREQRRFQEARASRDGRAFR